MSGFDEHKIFLKTSFDSWYEPLNHILTNEIFLKPFLKYMQNDELKPTKDKIFRAFSLCKYQKLKIVILGQDPYFSTHNGQNTANGLAFSVDNGMKIPPSLKNILKNLEFNFGFTPTKTDFSDVAKQGVLFLNTNLCVHKKALDCKDYGFLEFSDEVIKHIDENFSDVVFLLWGNYAKEKTKLIKNNRYLTSSHPSPLSANKKNEDNFLLQKHFLKANDILKLNNKTPIDWSVLA